MRLRRVYIIDWSFFELAGNRYAVEILYWLHVERVDRSENKYFLLLFCECHDTACDQVANGWALDKELSAQLDWMVLSVPRQQGVKILLWPIFVCKIVEVGDLVDEFLFEWFIQSIVHVGQSKWVCLTVGLAWPFWWVGLFSEHYKTIIINSWRFGQKNW